MDVSGSQRHGAGGSKGPRRSASRRPPAKSSTQPTDHGTQTLSFTFSSTFGGGHEAQKQILEAAERHGFHGESFFALRIALEEALVNAIKHGNRMDSTKLVRVEVKIDPSRIEIFVEDEGPGFHRDSVPDPTADENLHKCSGRGILLIEAYMSEVHWDHGGRRLHMVRENNGA